MTVIFMRHGESMANAWHPAYGDEGSNFLSPKGVRQAELAGHTIAGLVDHIDEVWSSEALRSNQTAVTAMQTFNFNQWKREYHRDARLNEWCYGADPSPEWHLHEPQDKFWNRVGDAFVDFTFGADDKKNYLVVTHYYTMTAIFEIIRRAIHDEVVDEPWPALELGETGAIPNAIPFVWDTTSDEMPQIILPGHHDKKR